jgi:hypothetical protein
LAGAWVSQTFNVSQADTNPIDIANANSNFGFKGPTGIFNTATGVTSSYLYNVNLLIAGTRVVNIASVTGAQPGDSLNAPGANTWVGGINSSIGVNGTVTNGPAAQCPVVNVEWKMSR